MQRKVKFLKTFFGIEKQFNFVRNGALKEVYVMHDRVNQPFLDREWAEHNSCEGTSLSPLYTLQLFVTRKKRFLNTQESRHINVFRFKRKTGIEPATLTLGR
jgi:hypothetical protein